MTSRIRDDRSPLWDADAGAGIIPETAIQSAFGGWNIIKFPAAAFGTVASLQLQMANRLTGFYVGIWGRKVTADQVLIATGSTVSEPDWNLVNPTWPDGSPTALLYAAGRPSSLCGWWPNPQADHNDPADQPDLTGEYRDHGTWDFYSQEPPWLWMSILSTTATTMTGKFYLADTQPQETD